MKKVILLLLSILGVFNIYSTTLFSSFKQGSVNGVKTLEGRLETGENIILINPDPFLDDNMEDKTLDIINKFSLTKFTDITITYNKDGLTTINFIPDSLIWDEVNLKDYLSSGFSIKLSDAISYDVDIFIDKKHLHVSGYYDDEESFLNKISNIIKHPADFLLSRDPEHIMNNFNRLESLITELKEENEQLKAELKELKYNNLVMESRGLFRTIKNLNRDDVEWIISAKESDSSLTSEQLQEKILTERGSKINGNVVDLIFGLYFSEYSE